MKKGPSYILLVGFRVKLVNNRFITRIYNWKSVVEILPGPKLDRQ